MPYIKQAVGSVRGQKNAEVQHIVQDGGSSDGTKEWLLEQGDLDVRSEADNGMYDAINKGWARAEGDVFSWLNVDEQYLPGTLNRVSEIFRVCPEVDVLFGDCIMVTPEGRPLAARREIPLRKIYLENGFLYALSCTTFFRRTLWDEGLLQMDDHFKNAGDYDLMLRLLCAGKKIQHVMEFLSLFGVVGDNLTLALGGNMDREVSEIQNKYGALPSAWMRKTVLFGRYIERFIRGLYRRETICYDFACDEVPHYERIKAEDVSGRFTFERARRMMSDKDE
jgi:glycosyltransferase involved in cell wall biosynthesis